MLVPLVLASACGGSSDESDSSPPDPQDTVATTTAGADDDTTTSSAAPPATDGDGTAADDAPEPERGGAATVYLAVLPSSIRGDAAGQGRNISLAIFGRLIEYGDDFTPVGVIAESFLPIDASTWELRLREGVTFTDGTPLDAEAVKYNWEWHADPANGSEGQTGAAQIASLEVVDPLTLTVVLATPNPEFFVDVSNGLLNAIGSPTAMQDPAAYALAPVGAGPFVVSDYLQDDHVTLVRNPDYVDPSKPYLDELTFRAIGESEQRLNVASTGQHLVVQIGDDSERVLFEEIGLHVVHTAVNGGLLYYMNNDVAPFDDVRVRQAVVQAIDLDELNRSLYDGNSNVADGPFDHSSAYYDPAITQLPYDFDAAQALIDDYVAEHGPVSFEILTSNIPGLPLEAEFVAQYLNELDGVSVSIAPREHTAYREASTSGNFAMSWGRTTFEGAGGNFRGRFYSTSPINYLNYVNPAVDRLFDDLATAIDIDERTRIVGEINQLMSDDAPLIWTLRSTESWGYTSDLGGVEAWGLSQLKPELFHVSG